MLNILSFIIICLFLTPILCDKQCFDNNVEKINRHLGASTPYRFIQNKNDQRVEYDGCAPVRAWVIIRHGSRIPSRKNIAKMNRDLVRIRDEILKSTMHKLCLKDIEKLKSWEPVYEEENAKFLVSVGEDELTELAERMQNRFPDVFSEYYDNSTYRFKFTNTQRTQKSFESFAKGLFGRQHLRQIWHEEPLDQDPILRFYKLCKRWRSSVGKNPESRIEPKKFVESSLMSQTVNKIKLKLGINQLTWEEIHIMYLACGFETSYLRSGFSPWCSVFDQETIKVFEFLQDLKHYWIDGYGYDLTHKVACPAINDMILRLDPKSNLPNTTVYFTHSGTILKYLAKLNLYKDKSHLLHTDFKKKRKWRVSSIDAFATNIAFVAFNCEDGVNILMLHQERVIKLPGCITDNGLCTFNEFKNIFKDDVDGCNFEEMCTTN